MWMTPKQALENNSAVSCGAYMFYLRKYINTCYFRKKRADELNE